MIRLIVLIITFLIISVDARLGESQAECEKRYKGKGRVVETTKSGKSVIYQTEQAFIGVTFYKGKAVQIHYYFKKAEVLNDYAVQDLLNKNIKSGVELDFCREKSSRTRDVFRGKDHQVMRTKSTITFQKISELLSYEKEYRTKASRTQTATKGL